MSDQVPEQSPQSRLETMLGDSVESDVKPPELQDEEEQTPLEAEAEDTEEVESEEATEEDLRDENGNYWSVAGDLSFMFPMFEMSGQEHYRFLPNINYIYNESNPINDHKVNMSNVTQTVNKIRNKTPYTKL